ncbi:hypothetical protein ACHQM5_028378 [Ranunculus cassubicifolius]
MAALRSSLRHYRLLTTITNPTATVTPTIATPNLNLKTNLQPDPSSSYDDNESYKTVKRLAMSKQYNKIESLIESHKKSSKITEERYVCTLIRYYGVAGMYKQAFNLFKQMEMLGTPRTSLSFNALLSAFQMCSKYGDVAKLFDKMPQKYGFEVDKITYCILIKSLCEMGSMEKVLMVLKEMELKRIEIGDTEYCMILNSLFKKKMVEEAEKMWKELSEKGWSPDVGAYNARIANVDEGKPEDILALMEEMKRNGVKPDTTSYNCLFSCYSKMGMVAEAQKVYKDLEGNGCSPNGSTYRSLIIHLCMTEDFDSAYVIFKESVTKGKAPAYRLLKKVVEGLVKCSKTDKAKELLETLRETYGDNLRNDWNKLELTLGLSNGEEASTQKASTDSA